MPYAQIIVLRYETPYYKKGLDEQKDKISSKTEIINEKDLNKYVNLVFDTQQAHRPFAIGALLVDINEVNCQVQKTPMPTNFSKDFWEILESKVSISNLFKEIEIFAKYYKNQL